MGVAGDELRRDLSRFSAHLAPASPRRAIIPLMIMLCALMNVYAIETQTKLQLVALQGLCLRNRPLDWLDLNCSALALDQFCTLPALACDENATEVYELYAEIFFTFVEIGRAHV